MLFPGITIDRQLSKSPKTVFFCKKCVVSNQRPRITFNEEGVCSACQYAHIKHNVIDWDSREKMLVELLDRFRSQDGSYDCVVPGSGGKDSSYVAHQLKYKYGMHPLTVTWAPFMYTDVGWQNYITFKDHGFDNLLCFPDGIVHRKLARLAFELLGDAWEPFAYGQKAYAFHMACKFKIPLIFYGESGEIEYGGSMKNIDKPHETVQDWKEFYYKGSGIDELTEHGLSAGIFKQDEIQENSFMLYRPPAPRELQEVNPQMHWFSFIKNGCHRKIIIMLSSTQAFRLMRTGVRKGHILNMPVWMIKQMAFIFIWHISSLALRGRLPMRRMKSVMDI